MILADALTYAGRYKPDFVVDYATLTGACLVALGPEVFGVMGNHQPLVDAILEEGAKFAENELAPLNPIGDREGCRLEAGAAALKPRGEMLIVANRTLPYEARLEELFTGVEALKVTGRYKVLRAWKVRRR